MTHQIGLDEYRQKVFTALKEAGYPVEQWQLSYEKQLADDPTAKARPFTTITPPRYGHIKKLRPGFEEFIPHPVHGKPVPRCQAARKRSEGKAQCKKFAANGKHLCRTHGGAAGSGKLSVEGRQNQIASVTLHGNETSAIRKIRVEKANERKRLAQIAVDAGLAKTTGTPRGSYYKPAKKSSSNA
jgi:hypothetical protein